MPTLFLEAFGQLSGPPIIDAQEEDIYSVFLERSELMGWGAASRADRPLLWAMEEAELNPDFDPGPTRGELVFDPDCIGFAQVGLGVGPVEPVEPPPEPRSGYSPLPYRRRSSEPVLVLPPLVQCFVDSLYRFGAVELSAIQVTAVYLEPSAQSRSSSLFATLNWFNLISKSSAEAAVSLDQALIGGHAESELVEILQHGNNDGPFEFGTSVAVPERHKVRTSGLAPRYTASPQLDTGVSVAMPEWTPSAVGWVLARVVDAARAIEPDASDFAVRVTRV